MKPIIRQDQQNDFQIIHDLTELAFRALEISDHTEHLLIERLRRSEGYLPELTLVAELGGRVVGHIMLSRVEIVDGDRRTPTLSVAPLSVLPEYQSQGIGSALMREAHRRAAERGYSSAMLVGHPDYYPRFGYKPANTFGIRFPFDAPDACCMAVELLPGGLNGVHGTVEFPKAFFE